MKVALLLLISLFAMSSIVLADTGKGVTFFSDGALVEVEVVAVKGIAELPLPGGVDAASLRIIPVGKATIQRVDLQPSRREEKGNRELDRLLEQKNRLNDRLQALEVREEIFRGAAKSQSAKSPRKTKTNPDPMQSIRQGTEFALAQLEAVYTARRRTMQDIRSLDDRIAALTRAGQRTAAMARVAVSPKNGRIRVRYVLPGQGWSPRYDVHLNDDGRALLTLFGRLPGGFTGYLLQAAPVALADSVTATTLPAVAGAPTRLAEYLLPVRNARFVAGALPLFSFELTNTGTAYLTAGEATLYRNGEFWGRFRFAGISSARSRTIVSGR